MKINNKMNPAKTVLTISVGFLLVYLVTKAQWSLQVAFIIGLVGVLSDYLSKKIEYLWMKLTWLLSKIVPNILLGAVFYIFLFPIALISRVFGKNDNLKLRNKSATVFVETNKTFDKHSFENPW
jgi:hypothetical protein